MCICVPRRSQTSVLVPYYQLDGRKEYQSIVEQNMQAGGNGVHMYGRGGDTAFNYRRVRFKEDEALVAEFDDTNLWAHGKEALCVIMGVQQDLERAGIMPA